MDEVIQLVVDRSHRLLPYADMPIVEHIWSTNGYRRPAYLESKLGKVHPYSRTELFALEFK